MKNQFVTYEIASALKELGFDEKCFGYYRPMKDWMMKGTKNNPAPHFHGCNWANNANTFYFMYLQNSSGDRDSVVKNSEFTKAVENIAVPLWQQVIDFLREKYSIYIEITLCTAHDLDTKVVGEGMEKLWRSLKFSREDFIEARETAILKAIEFIKYKNS